VHSGTRPRRSLDPVAVRPPRALGVIIGCGFTACALVFALLLVQVAVGAPVGFKTFLAWIVAGALAVIAAVFANWTYALFSLSYVIDRDTLTLSWGFRDVIIPIDTIQRMVPGRTLDEAHVHGLNWWGCHIGAAEVKRIGYTLFYSTHSSPDELLYVVTTQEAYALTVLNQAGFAEEVQARAALGPVEQHLHRSSATGIAALPFWRDRVAIAAVALSALCCAVLCGYVFAKYPGLPSVVQLSFPELGGVIRVGDKGELLRLAYLGAGIFLFNLIVGLLVHARERAAGLWLLASGGMLQGVLLIAAVIAFQRAA
jgi:hypothetical protein